MIVIQMPLRQPHRPIPACAEPEAVPAGLEAWPSEQLWLSQGCWLRSAQDRMMQAVTSAVDAVLAASDGVVAEHELLLVLRWTRQPAAALRLSARILRGTRDHATPRGRDLAATALLLAATRHDDLLAAVEFAAEATGRAFALEAALAADEPSLPPGFRSVGQLAGRMRRRAREVLAHTMTWPDLDTVGSCLERALMDDPLRRPDQASGGAPA